MLLGSIDFDNWDRASPPNYFDFNMIKKGSDSFLADNPSQKCTLSHTISLTKNYNDISYRFHGKTITLC